ncbi:hypothetical protein B0H13DRAFT_1906805 [Mycena leptocephala]|nr:hypothetical protein B0H13DRAFT_1906805 [Mycena leptocephala]
MVDAHSFIPTVTIPILLGCWLVTYAFGRDQAVDRRGKQDIGALVKTTVFDEILIRALCSANSKNALRGDNYNATYGLEGFYTNASAISTFNGRITHILSMVWRGRREVPRQTWTQPLRSAEAPRAGLAKPRLRLKTEGLVKFQSAQIGTAHANQPPIGQQALQPFQNIHKNTLLGNRSWSELSDYIFGFEAQNEAISRGSVTPRSKNNVADSVQPIFCDSSCTAIDVVAIHYYTDIKVQKINNYKLPFLYWELISNPDPHQGEDYEIQVNAMDADWILLFNASLTAAALTNAPFDFSAALALNESATGEEYLSW